MVKSLEEIRRIVTGHDADGKSVFVIDGPPDTSSGVIWVTNQTPADNSGKTDTAHIPFKVEPPDNGSKVGVFIMPPDKINLSKEEREQASREFFKMVGEHVRGDTSRHPRMHKSRTIDYVCLLAGEVTMLLDKGEVTLKPGDVVVQRGTSHAWENRGKENAVLMAVVIDAKPV